MSANLLDSIYKALEDTMLIYRHHLSVGSSAKVLLHISQTINHLTSSLNRLNSVSSKSEVELVKAKPLLSVDDIFFEGDVGYEPSKKNVPELGLVVEKNQNRVTSRYVYDDGFRGKNKQVNNNNAGIVQNDYEDYFR